VASKTRTSVSAEASNLLSGDHASGCRPFRRRSVRMLRSCFSPSAVQMTIWFSRPIARDLPSGEKATSKLLPTEYLPSLLFPVRISRNHNPWFCNEATVLPSGERLTAYMGPVIGTGHPFFHRRSRSGACRRHGRVGRRHRRDIRTTRTPHPFARQLFLHLEFLAAARTGKRDHDRALMLIHQRHELLLEPDDLGRGRLISTVHSRRLQERPEEPVLRLQRPDRIDAVRAGVQMLLNRLRLRRRQPARQVRSQIFRPGTISSGP